MTVYSTIRLLGIAVAVIGAVGCDIEAQSRTVDGSFDRTVKVSGPVNLDIQSRSGRIEVRVGDGDAVRIVGRIRASGSFSAFTGGYSAEEQVKSLMAAPPIEQSDNAISVGEIREPGLGDNVSISYEVTVPADTRLRATSRSGNQTIDRVRGPVMASSRSGNIQIEHVAGDVEAETRSGDVDVRLPADGGAMVDVGTRSGAVDGGVPTLVDGGRRGKHIRGTIGPGGRRVEIRTRSGSVRIR